MSLALKFGDPNDTNSVSGVVYFDAVTKYGKSYGGKVTEHPIEAGASITDHYVSSNKRYTISGVISSVDFSSIPGLAVFEGESPINSSPPPSPVSISNMGGALINNIPTMVSQFLGGMSSQVAIDQSERTNYRQEIEELFEEVLHGLYFNEERDKYENRMTLMTLFEMEPNSANYSKMIEDLVLVGLNITEDENSGDAMFFDAELVQVHFVVSESADAPSPPKGSKASRTTAPKKQRSTRNPPPVDETKHRTARENVGSILR